MIGEKFGLLEVIGRAANNGSHTRWHCRCECGKETVVWGLSLKRGTTRSCGHLKDAAVKQRWADYRSPAFWARVDKRGKKDCWNWLGSQGRSEKNKTQYGCLGFEGTHQRAHRVAYRLVKGEIPKGLMVLHKCDNTLCCNPAHLYLGDHSQNMRDIVERGLCKGANAGEKNGRAKLTQEQAEEIRMLYAAGAGGLSQQALANMFDVSQNAISKIVCGKRYAAT